ncbi:MAG: hypothetical protein INQ03_08715 [Candidatus Heimdallarchaeota archaeon]|nr:hypothetical protein [Candidatus Heimdallarchaeota archaeon]
MKFSPVLYSIIFFFLLFSSVPVRGTEFSGTIEKHDFLTYYITLSEGDDIKIEFKVEDGYKYSFNLNAPSSTLLVDELISTNFTLETFTLAEDGEFKLSISDYNTENVNGFYYSINISSEYFWWKDSEYFPVIFAGSIGIMSIITFFIYKLERKYFNKKNAQF